MSDSSKTKLEPLQQWYCDTCGQIIERPEHGYLEWKNKDVSTREDFRHLRYGFRIVHNAARSPLREERGRDGCFYTNMERGGELPLTEFVGVSGLIYAVNWIDVGQAFDGTYRGPEVRDLREW